MVFSSVFSTNKMVLGVLFIMVVLSWWWSQMEGVLPEVVRTARHAPDYWIDGLVAKTMNAEGRLNRVIMAEHTEHFPDDGSTDIVRPQMDFIGPSNEPPWRVRSETGWLAPDGKQLLLKGIVTIDKEAAPESLPVHITTRELRVQLQENYAETSELVHMKSGRNHVRARGMQVWLKKPIRVKLLANVRASYEISQ